MAVTRVLTATEYGRIPTFECQMNAHLSSHFLQLVARIFIDEGLEEDYGLGILHRHFDLSPGTILIHSKTPGLHEICTVRKMSEIPLASLRAHSYYLNDAGELQPYEYELDSSRPELRRRFVQKLRNLLVQNNLVNVLAIIPNPRSSEELFEFQLADDMGMLLIPKSRVMEKDIQDTIPVITGWAFSVQNGSMQIRAIQQCTEQTSGYHKKVS